MWSDKHDWRGSIERHPEGADAIRRRHLDDDLDGGLAVVAAIAAGHQRAACRPQNGASGGSAGTAAAAVMTHPVQAGHIASIRASK